jgi:hypothetical protein
MDVHINASVSNAIHGQCDVRRKSRVVDFRLKAELRRNWRDQQEVKDDEMSAYFLGVKDSDRYLFPKAICA